jgi:uncharacterized Zn finger protein
MLKVKRLVHCFECGTVYDRKTRLFCPQCGEEKVFIPALHDENYDITKDTGELARMRLYGIAAALVLLVLTLNLR